MNPFYLALLPPILKIIPNIIQLIKEISLHKTDAESKKELAILETRFNLVKAKIEMRNSISNKDKSYKKEKTEECFKSIDEMMEWTKDLGKVIKPVNSKKKYKDWIAILNDFNKVILVVKNGSGLINSLNALLKIKKLQYSANKLSLGDK